MRIWSLHPSYLDTKGLLAVWRESLLAKKVLEGKTVGYKNHPQLIRFKTLSDPVKGINRYLEGIYKESIKRGYLFDKEKIGEVDSSLSIKVTNGQVEYEYAHLLKKLKNRDHLSYMKLKKEKNIKLHDMFNLVQGEVEDWEKVYTL